MALKVYRGQHRDRSADQKKLDWEKHLEKLQEDFFKMKSGSDKFSYSDRKVIDNGSVSVETDGFPRPRSRAGYVSTDNPLYKDTGSGLKFHIEFHMEGYKPEEITVKTDGGTLFVHARHEEVKDGTRRTSSEYKRKVEVPDDVDPDTLNSFFTGDGVLTIEAPVLPDYRSLNRSTRSTRSAKSASDFDSLNASLAGYQDIQRPKSALGLTEPSSPTSSFPSYVQSLKRQPKKQGRSSRYSLGGSELYQPQKKSNYGRKSLGYYSSTSSLPGAGLGRADPAPLSLMDTSYTRDRVDSDRESIKSSPGYFHSLPRGRATSALSIRTDFPSQTDNQETSDLETSPKSPGLIRDILNGSQSVDTTRSIMQNHQQSFINEPSFLEQSEYHSRFDNDNLTNGYVPPDQKGRESAKSFTSENTDAGYMTGSPGTDTPAEAPTVPEKPKERVRSSRASLGGPLTSQYLDRTLDGSIIATTDRNGNYKTRSKRYSFGVNPQTREISQSTPSVFNTSNLQLDRTNRLNEFKSRMSNRNRLIGKSESIREIPEYSQYEPRFHTPIIMNTPEGRKLRMVVDIGPPFTPENINVKSTSRKVIIEARKIGTSGDKRERLGFTREAKLPEPINPHSLRARFSDDGKLTLTAMVK